MITIILIMLIKSPDDEDAEDGESKSNASPQRLEMGTGSSAELELTSVKMITYYKNISKRRCIMTE